MRNVTEPLDQDARAILKRLPAFEQALEAMDIAAIASFLHFAARSLEAHRYAADQVLLPVLVRHCEREASPAAPTLSSRPHEDAHWSEFQGEVRGEAERLHQEHGYLTAAVEALAKATGSAVEILTVGEIRKTGRQLTERLRLHLAAELERFYPITERLLSEGEKQAVRIGMAARPAHRGS